MEKELFDKGKELNEEKNLTTQKEQNNFLKNTLRTGN